MSICNNIYCVCISNLKSALRTIRRAKLFSLINIVGLASGLTAAILIALWVQNEFSYDKYNVNADRIYRVTSRWVYGNGDYTMPWTAGPLAGRAQSTSTGEICSSIKHALERRCLERQRERLRH